MKKVIIKKKLITKVCCCCFVRGQKPLKSCKQCNGTGRVEDSIYYHIANGMCFDGDTVK